MVIYLRVEHGYLKVKDLKISRLGLGTHQLGASWGVPNKNMALEIINTALDNGINWIDTAETYNDGISEKFIGEALKRRGDREDVIIVTKVSIEHLRYRLVLKAVDMSLDRLQTNYVDICLIHWPDPYVPVRETISALDKLIDEGKIRYIGLSNFPACLVREAIHYARHEIVTNQLLYNLIERDIEKEILHKMRELEIPIMAYSPLAMGYLTGKYSKPTIKSDDDPRRFIPWGINEKNFVHINRLLDVVRNIAKKYGKTIAQVSLNWLLANDDIFPVVGATKPEHVLENIGSMGWRLRPEDIETLNKTSKEIIEKMEYW